MDRYSFFILVTVCHCVFISAVTVSADDLRSGNDVGSDLYNADSGLPENMLDTPDLGIQGQEPVAEYEENQEYAPEVVPISPPWLADSALFQGADELATSEDGSSLESPSIRSRVALARATWTNAFFSTTRGGPANVAYINGAFDGWNIYAWHMPNAESINFDLLLRATKNSIFATNARIDDVKNSTTSRMNNIDAGWNNAVKNLQTNINNVNSKATSRMNNIDSYLHSSVTSLQNNINALNTKVTSRMDNIDAGWQTAVKNLQNNINANSTRIGNMDTFMHSSVTSLQNNINALNTKTSERMDNMDKFMHSSVTSLQNNINALNTKTSERMDNMDSFMHSSVTNLQKNISANSERIENMDSYMHSSVTNLQKNISANSQRMDNIDSFIHSSVTNLQNNINALGVISSAKDSDLQSQIDAIKTNGGTSWSDVGIIAALLAVKDSIDKFKMYFEEDGVFMKLLKGQFEGLKDLLKSLRIYTVNDIRAIINDYFSAEDGKGTGIFSEFLDTLLYGIRYSIVEGFGESLDMLLDIFQALISTMRGINVLIDYAETLTKLVDLLKGRLDLILQYLVKLMNKTFDFDRLEALLSKLSFGNIVNEAGSNIWDFLKELIGTLGSSLKDILDFLNNLLDKIIALIVPENLDFLDHEWTGVSDKIQLKFSFIFDSVSSIKNLFSGSQKSFEDLDVDFGSSQLAGNTIAIGTVKLPMSHLNKFLAVVKPFANGGILLWFLIDMYRWIHERNAVVE
ncbi:hypothetical protein [Enterococcus sp. LJL51]|uniref:hypothetical protein n=1 Tax=Enterococcus sp. LJL51 TaxID=3416656 RepID=UPI003CF605CC